MKPIFALERTRYLNYEAMWDSVGYNLLICSVKNSLPKLWGGVRFSSVKTLYLLCKELVTCFILGARRTDICINWKLSRGEFSEKRPKLGLWCKNDKSFEKELSPPTFQVLTCRETTQRELIKKKLLKIEISHANCLKCHCVWRNLQSQTASLQMDYLLKTNLIKKLKTLFTWSGGPRSSGVGFFCFVSPRAWKQKKPTPPDRGPPLHVNRP